MKVSDFLEHFNRFAPYTQTNIIKSLVIVAVLWIIRILILRLAFRRIPKAHSRSIWKESVNYITFILALILLGHVWLQGIKSVLTYLAVIATGLTLVLKEVILNFAANFMIIWRGLFNVGNRIQIGDYREDVIELGPFYFTLMEVEQWVDADQSTGRIVKVPNCMVLTQPVMNYSRGLPYIWNEISVLITTTSDWKQAKEILNNLGYKCTRTVSEAAIKFLKEKEDEVIEYKKLTPIVYTKLTPEGIVLTLRYLCAPRKRRSSEHALWEEIIEEFRKVDDVTVVQK